MTEIPEIQAGDGEILRRKCGHLAEQLRIARIQVDADGEVIAELRAALKEARDNIRRLMELVLSEYGESNETWRARKWLAAHKEATNE